jgi:hypothetical protein
MGDAPIACVAGLLVHVDCICWHAQAGSATVDVLKHIARTTATHATRGQFASSLAIQGTVRLTMCTYLAGCSFVDSLLVGSHRAWQSLLALQAAAATQADIGMGLNAQL